MSYESLPIKLHAENVQNNVQTVQITHCSCGPRVEELLKENQENRKLLKRIEALLIKVVSSVPASVELASVSASASSQNTQELTKTKFLN